MTFWQENYAFIKDVYESRSSKLVELMDKVDKAIAAILADKIYTSNEFKKLKETFVVRERKRKCTGIPIFLCNRAIFSRRLSPSGWYRFIRVAE